MWRKFGICLLIVLFLSVSGCSQIVHPPGSQTRGTSTPTPVPGPKYTIGDVVKNTSADNTGIIIIDYDLKTKSYKARPVIYDNFGRIFYLKDQGEQSLPFTTLESFYPTKTGNVDNIYGIGEMSYTKPKFAIGSIHREEENKNEGIIIFSYDYLTGQYTYAYAHYKGGGIWDYDEEAKQIGERAAIEERYKK